MPPSFASISLPEIQQSGCTNATTTPVFSASTKHDSKLLYTPQCQNSPHHGLLVAPWCSNCTHLVVMYNMGMHSSKQDKNLEVQL
jgi:hypothetical protein